MSHGMRNVREHVAVQKRASTCPATQMYKFPNSTSTISTADPVTFTWDTTCLTTDSVDIYLYSYQTSSSGSSGQTGMIQAWKATPWEKGSLDVGKLNPAWWNYTQDASLQLAIVEAGNPRFFATPGPVFEVTVPEGQLSSASSAVAGSETKTAADGSQTTTTDSSGIFQSVSLGHSGLSKGALAAAVVVPILVVGVLVGIYIKFARTREMEKRKRWSEHVDRRMSTISQDWRSGGGSVAGGAGGIRSSMVSNGTRGGSVYFANGANGARASSYSVGDVNFAGAGAGGTRIPRVGANGGNPEMRQSQLRQSIFNASTPELASHITAGPPHAHARQSRVSFAADDAIAFANKRKSRVSFSDAGAGAGAAAGGGALRPVQSNMSALQSAGRNNRGSVFINNGDLGGERHSIDNSRLSQAKINTHVNTRRVQQQDEEFALSPSQVQGPFSLPTAAVAPVEPAKKGFFGALASAVGLKDQKKEGAGQGQEQRMREQDQEQAEMTRRSEDAMRNMEATVLRRSQIISQYSANNGSQQSLPLASTPTHIVGNDDEVEELSAPEARAKSPMGMAPPPSGMNPDQLLAAYAAARNGGSASGDNLSAPSPTGGARPTSNISDASAYSTTTGVQGGH